MNNLEKLTSLNMFDSSFVWIWSMLTLQKASFTGELSSGILKNLWESPKIDPLQAPMVHVGAYHCSSSLASQREGKPSQIPPSRCFFLSLVVITNDLSMTCWLKIFDTANSGAYFLSETIISSGFRGRGGCVEIRMGRRKCGILRKEYKW